MLNNYYEWLCQRVNPEARPFSKLFLQLFSTTFKGYTKCPTDIHRAEDGQYLRYEFENEYGKSSSFSEEDPANVLEVLVALSSRIDDILGEPSENHTPAWFWVMITNLGLIRYVDHLYSAAAVSDILTRWMDRQYAYNGEGGIFPLQYPTEDQRQVNLWDQMAYYINENGF